MSVVTFCEAARTRRFSTKEKFEPDANSRSLRHNAGDLSLRSKTSNHGQKKSRENSDALLKQLENWMRRKRKKNKERRRTCVYATEILYHFHKLRKQIHTMLYLGNCSCILSQNFQQIIRILGNTGALINTINI